MEVQSKRLSHRANKASPLNCCPDNTYASQDGSWLDCLLLQSQKYRAAIKFLNIRLCVCIVCVHCTYREWIKDRLEDEKGVNGPQESKDLDAFILLIQHAESIWHLCNFHELSLRKYLIRSCISHLISHYFLSQAAGLDTGCSWPCAVSVA